MNTIDQNDPLSWLGAELESLEHRGLRRRLEERTTPAGSRICFGGREMINFGSNDYLGLAADERVVAAAMDAMRRFGWGGAASPLVGGCTAAHAELQQRIAAFEGAEAALVFPSGYAANSGVIPALVDESDAIYADAKNHASLIDGCRLSNARRFVYAHADAAALEALLREGGSFRRRLIVTDALFSMDGDLAPLADLSRLAEFHAAMLLVDEAHATGVFGEHGRGVVEFMNAVEPRIERNVPIRVGTLSKAIGSAGGFVCGSHLLIEWLANRVRPFVFSTAAPAAVAAAASAAISIIETESHRRRELLSRAGELRDRLARKGWNLGRSESQIIPVYVGDAAAAVAMADRLRRHGIFVPAIRPPTVPSGESLLRIILTWSHTQEMIAALEAALDAAK